MDQVSRILLVGGNSPATARTEASLQRAGHEVVGVATTAERALDLAELHAPDLVMCCAQVMGREIAAVLQRIRRELGIPCLQLPIAAAQQACGDTALASAA